MIRPAAALLAATMLAACAVTSEPPRQVPIARADVLPLAPVEEAILLWNLPGVGDVLRHYTDTTVTDYQIKQADTAAIVAGTWTVLGIVGAPRPCQNVER